MVQLTDLCFAYRGERPLFDNLQLKLTGGNIYGLLGKNGAGKTTLLKIITGLLFAKSGSSTVLGCDSSKRSPDYLREVVFIPEEFYVPPITCAAYKQNFAPLYPRFSEQDLATYLREFGIQETDRLSALSYGNKKKFLIAFGLATHCRLLILDEPTNGLDIPTKSQFRKLLAGALNDDRIFVVSTHQVRDMENLIDPVIIIDNGKIVFHHSSQEVGARLSVSTVEDPSTVDNVLFSEKSLGGYTVVTANSEGGESRVDLELLFNAVAANSAKVEELFAEGVAK